MAQTYLDEQGNPIKGTGAYLNDDGKVVGPKTTAGDTESKASLQADSGIGPYLHSDPEAVTIGDLIRDPGAAFSKMFAITKKGLSDPRNTIPAAVGLAAGVTGLMPRSFASTRGMAPVSAPAAAVAPAARGGLGQALRENVSLDDVVGAIPGAHTAKSAYRVVQGVRRALQQNEPSAASSAPPAEVAPAPAPTPDVPVTPTPTPPRPATKTVQSPKPKAAPKASSAPAAESLPSLDELSLTPAEIQQGVKWHEQGVSPETIIHRILQSRQLTQRLHTETPDQAAEAVRQRNETGRWKD